MEMTAAASPVGRLELIPGELRDALAADFPDQVTTLDVRLVGDTFVIVGEVGSEPCKSAAKRLLLGMDGVFKVRNELIVAAALQGASDDDGEDGFFDAPAGPDWLRGTIVRKGSTTAEGPSSRHGRLEGPGIEYGSFGGDEVEDVTRFPELAVEGEVAASTEFTLVVDLVVQRRDAVQAIAIGRFPADWPMIEVNVQISSPLLSRIDDEPAMVVVRPGGASEPARIRCVAAAGVEPGGTVPLKVYFLHGTRICGDAEWTLHAAGERPAQPAPAEEAGEVAQDGPSSTDFAITITPDAPGPTLTIIINADADGVQRWNWIAITPGGTRNGSERIDLGEETAKFAAGLLAAAPAMSKQEFRRRMKGVGTRIWNVAPRSFRDALPTLRSSVGPSFPVQFLSDDPFVPWELMTPDDGSDHLHLEHPVARWPLGGRGTLHKSLPNGMIMSFVPEYDRNRTLPSAREEAQWLRDELGAQVEAPTRESFLRTMDGANGRGIGVVHFAGHGRADMGIGDAAIELQDGWVTSDDVNQSGVRLGEYAHCLVVLNACQLASEQVSLGLNGGWCAALAARDFGGLVAPLWAVQDRTAFEIVKVALAGLITQNETLGQTMLMARRSQAESSVAALAYLAHGDVMARVER